MPIWKTHGVIAPGASAGILNITQQLRSRGADGRLDIERWFLGAGVDFDRLLVSSNATLNGCARML